MPIIEMRDAFGTMHRIDSLSWNLIGLWLEEWVPRLFPADLPEEYGKPLISAWPLQVAPDKLAYDWVGDTRFMREMFQVSRDPVQALADIRAKQAELEQKVKEAASDGDG